jgi:lipoprotein-releasing system ATP-binding protein
MPHELPVHHDLAVQHVTKVFDGGAEPVVVLEDAQLNLMRGEAMAITGPSGTGKSTLLYIIGVLDEPTSGKVTLFGKEPHRMSLRERAQFRNEQIGFVFQDHHLLPQCSVLENVLLPTLPGEGVTPASQEFARRLLDRVQLGHRLTHRPGELSGGERQRVAVCRALINRPGLLLADEPTGNLDQASADRVGDLLLELVAEFQLMLICVTHSQKLAGRFPKWHEISGGKLVRKDGVAV